MRHDEDNVLARAWGSTMEKGAPWRHRGYDWDQIISSAEGSFQIVVENRQWKIGVGQGLWIPSGFPHEITMLSRATMRAFYVRERVLPDCRLLQISPLLREVIAKAVQAGALFRDVIPGEGLTQVALSEIRDAKSIPLLQQFPTTTDLLSVARQLSEIGPFEDSIDTIAANTGTSRRTLERRFRQELSVGVAEWRRDCRLIESVRLLQEGETVASIAYRVGYSSGGAFVDAFRSKFGVAPGRYRSGG